MSLISFVISPGNHDELTVLASGHPRLAMHGLVSLQPARNMRSAEIVGVENASHIRESELGGTKRSKKTITIASYCYWLLESIR